MCVLFFGTKEFGFVDRDKIEDYTQNREKFIGKGRGSDFKYAVNQMDNYISDPTKFRSNAFVKPTNKKVPIKTERDIERRLGVKTEPSESNELIANDLSNNLTESKWQDEKKIMIQKILALKTENQQHLLTLKKSQAECNAMQLSKQKLEQAIVENEVKFSMQLKELQSKLSAAEIEIREMKTINEKTISDLKREQRLLVARTKQYQTGMGMHQSTSLIENHKPETDNREYEVDAIIKHRDRKGGRQYLIRWKGYGSEEDSWEKEGNMSCPKVLKEYIKSIQQN
ncbi:uncharacterized protein LOC116339963 [Contarinia nasturtii]|uniref:uncharacterized protein LOC116339963 n=1 Tax=Contarinia nasturtii TaxID=265458 RepID=UPI0012D43841|nr:uncharacterized protein LOC116339963 [Contarinia nasturtii]